jgi:hypothetical protein
MLYGYFLDEKLIGFNTLIKNGTSLDTYFLGYDDKIQKEKMLYLNMLYDMIACGISLQFKNIIFETAHTDGAKNKGYNYNEIVNYLKSIGYSVTNIDWMNSIATLNS